MHQAATILAGAAFRALCKHVQDNSRKSKEPPSLRPQWINSITVPQPLSEVRAQIEAYLSKRGFAVVTRERKSAFYQRGDRGVTRLPFDRDVRWHEVPIVLTVVFGMERGKTTIGLCFGGWPSTRFAESVGAFFNEHAEREIDGMVDFLNGVAEAPAGDPTPRDTTLDEDLTLLGLTRGFSWDQLQSAYRAACRKYHPDRLVGVEPDVVKLAERHFTQITAAYQRLRVRVPQPQAS